MNRIDINITKSVLLLAPIPDKFQAYYIALYIYIGIHEGFNHSYIESLYVN